MYSWSRWSLWFPYPFPRHALSFRDQSLRETKTTTKFVLWVVINTHWQLSVKSWYLAHSGAQMLIQRTSRKLAIYFQQAFYQPQRGSHCLQIWAFSVPSFFLNAYKNIKEMSWNIKEMSIPVPGWPALWKFFSSLQEGSIGPYLWFSACWHRCRTSRHPDQQVPYLLPCPSNHNKNHLTSVIYLHVVYWEWISTSLVAWVHTIFNHISNTLCIYLLLDLLCTLKDSLGVRRSTFC